MLRCFIAEDESPARQRLKRLLLGLEGVSLVGEAGDGVSALEQVSTLEPDLLLLDIQMPELDGLGVASALGSSGPAIIFVTAYDEHALKAFELSAVDYLVKPVSRERLAAAVSKVRQMRGGSPATPALEALAQRLEASRPRRMAVRCGAKYVVFDPGAVYGLVSKDHYSTLLLDTQQLLADEPLEQLAKRFDANQFVRVHRSAVINLAHLRELVHEGDRRYVAVLADRSATRVAVSRERLPVLKAALGLE